jgi:phosphoglycolate phosphatase
MVYFSVITMKRGLMDAEAVVFDYDGTLVHLNINFSVMREGVEKALADHGVNPDAYKGLLILEMIDEVRKLISERNPLEGRSFYRKALELVTEHEVRAAKRGRVLLGAIETLRLLKKRGIKVGIITRNCSKAVKIVFPNIESLCDVFLPRDSVTRVKPHPDHLTLVLKTIAINRPVRCLMVGDHIIDIEGGRRMGMKTAGVLTGKATYQDFMKAGADFIVKDVTRIPDCICQEQERWARIY